MNRNIFKRRELSNEELNNEADFLAYVLNKKGINLRDGGTETTHHIREVFDYPAGGCCQESPVIQRAYDKNLLIVVERPYDGNLLGGTHYGLQNRKVTANPFPNIPAKLLEYGNDYAQLKISSPQKRVTELQAIIEEALRDTKPLEDKIFLLTNDANVMYDEILSQSSKNTIELMQAGGFTITPLGIEPIQKEIEQIKMARKKVDGYSREKLELVSSELQHAKVADEFYLGKPPLKQDELMAKQGEEGIMWNLYPKVTLLGHLTPEDVREQRKTWEKLRQRK